MTEDGFKLYHLGLVNGPNSKIFYDYFTQTVLITGHHLDLIFDLDNLCNQYRGKKTIMEIRDQMLNDIHISELHDFLKPDLIFQNINLRGGICYFLWNKSYDNSISLTKVLTYNDDLTPKVNIRSLRTEDSDILIRHSLAVEMLKKIKLSNVEENYKTKENRV